MTFYEKLFKLISHLKLSLQITTTTTTNPYPTKWGQLHGSNDVIVFYHKPNLDPTHWTSKSFLNGFSNSFPRSSSTSFNLTLLHLIYSSYHDIYASSNHLSLFSTNFSTISVTPTLSLMVSFLILSCLALPLIQRNILIYATLT